MLNAFLYLFSVTLPQSFSTVRPTSLPRLSTSLTITTATHRGIPRRHYNNWPGKTRTTTASALLYRLTRRQFAGMSWDCSRRSSDRRVQITVELKMTKKILTVLYLMWFLIRDVSSDSGSRNGIQAGQCPRLDNLGTGWRLIGSSVH